MSHWTPYEGQRYLDWASVDAWCRQTATENPDYVALQEVGLSREGRPLLLLTIGAQDGRVDERPAFWLDGGTHAAEWTGVMAALHTVSAWVERLRDGQLDELAYFDQHTVYVMPCISPDGFEALVQGAPFIRSSVRLAPNSGHRVGLDPQDMTGDGSVRWMRWKHPAGPYMIDPDSPMFMRPRRLDDDPNEAWFFCAEGLFLNWDGHRWTDAATRFGLDLNRNFPGHWAPFSMFGMDGGVYPLSEPESRAVVDTFAPRQNIAAALTNHTYTGCILTQPYRQNSPLGQGDIRLMERMAIDAAEGTDYRVIRVVPDFVYDPKKEIVGVWSDTMSTTFGVPAYTLELWDPFKFADVENEKPAEFFSRPDPEKIKAIIEAFAEIEGAVSPWASFEHPQLGSVEIGGIDYMRTVRNPPEHLLSAECDRGRVIADRLRRALPRVVPELQITHVDDGLSRLDFCLENFGFLSTSGLSHGEGLPGTLTVQAELQMGEGLSLETGTPVASIGHLDGWGSYAGGGMHSVYPGLPDRGHRGYTSWWVRGSGSGEINWVGGRGGRGSVSFSL
jgi:hypothetical protein